ncbi:hypothetical protein ABB02_01740 [Clostridiaceae bacterium JG1575]|nr:hypothetical protein ABB02_01740 [Clostridiaceae bacterium JG1575]
MSVSIKDVAHIEELARLSYTERERESLVEDLNNILKYVGELQEVQTGDAVITVNPIPITNRIREDVPGVELGAQGFLANAPDRVEGYLRVPVVIGGSDEES